MNRGTGAGPRAAWLALVLAGAMWLTGCGQRPGPAATAAPPDRPAAPPAAAAAARDEAAVEAEVRAIAKQLACLVCRGQSVWDSSSEWARQRLEEVRAMVRAGMSREQVLQVFVDRYGPGVLLAPPPRGLLVAAWAVPLGVLGILAGGFAMGLRAARRRAAAAERGSPPPDGAPGGGEGP